MVQNLAEAQVAKFKEKRFDVKGFAIVDVLVYTHPSNSMWCEGISVKELVKTLALRLAEVKAKTVSNTLDHVNAKALVNKFAATLSEMKAKTTGGIRRDVEIEPLWDRTADTLHEVKVTIISAY